MIARRLVILAVTLALVFTLAPSASASHPCIDDPLCQPHEDPDPKEIINAVWDRVQCFIIAQPPTACV